MSKRKKKDSHKEEHDSYFDLSEWSEVTSTNDIYNSEENNNVSIILNKNDILKEIAQEFSQISDNHHNHGKNNYVTLEDKSKNSQKSQYNSCYYNTKKSNDLESGNFSIGGDFLHPRKFTSSFFKSIIYGHTTLCPSDSHLEKLSVCLTRHSRVCDCEYWVIAPLVDAIDKWNSIDLNCLIPEDFFLRGKLDTLVNNKVDVLFPKPEDRVLGSDGVGGVGVGVDKYDELDYGLDNLDICNDISVPSSTSLVKDSDTSVGLNDDQLKTDSITQPCQLTDLNVVNNQDNMSDDQNPINDVTVNNPSNNTSHSNVNPTNNNNSSNNTSHFSNNPTNNNNPLNTTLSQYNAVHPPSSSVNMINTFKKINSSLTSIWPRFLTLPPIHPYLITGEAKVGEFNKALNKKYIQVQKDIFQHCKEVVEWLAGSDIKVHLDSQCDDNISCSPLSISGQSLLSTYLKYFKQTTPTAAEVLNGTATTHQAVPYFCLTLLKRAIQLNNLKLSKNQGIFRNIDFPTANSADSISDKDTSRNDVNEDEKSVQIANMFVNTGVGVEMPSFTSHGKLRKVTNTNNNHNTTTNNNNIITNTNTNTNSNMDVSMNDDVITDSVNNEDGHCVDDEDIGLDIDDSQSTSEDIDTVNESAVDSTHLSVDITDKHKQGEQSQDNYSSVNSSVDCNNHNTTKTLSPSNTSVISSKYLSVHPSGILSPSSTTPLSHLSVDIVNIIIQSQPFIFVDTHHPLSLHIFRQYLRGRLDPFVWRDSVGVGVGVGGVLSWMDLLDNKNQTMKNTLKTILDSVHGVGSNSIKSDHPIDLSNQNTSQLYQHILLTSFISSTSPPEVKVNDVDLGVIDSVDTDTSSNSSNKSDSIDSTMVDILKDSNSNTDVSHNTSIIDISEDNSIMVEDVLKDNSSNADMFEESNINIVNVLDNQDNDSINYINNVTWTLHTDITTKPSKNTINIKVNSSTEELFSDPLKKTSLLKTNNENSQKNTIDSKIPILPTLSVLLQLDQSSICLLLSHFTDSIGLYLDALISQSDLLPTHSPTNPPSTNNSSNNSSNNSTNNSTDNSTDNSSNNSTNNSTDNSSNNSTNNSSNNSTDNSSNNSSNNSTDNSTPSQSPSNLTHLLSTNSPTSSESPSTLSTPSLSTNDSLSSDHTDSDSSQDISHSGCSQDTGHSGSSQDTDPILSDTHHSFKPREKYQQKLLQVCALASQKYLLRRRESNYYLSRTNPSIKTPPSDPMALPDAILVKPISNLFPTGKTVPNDQTPTHPHKSSTDEDVLSQPLSLHKLLPFPLAFMPSFSSLHLTTRSHSHFESVNDDSDDICDYDDERMGQSLISQSEYLDLYSKIEDNTYLPSYFQLTQLPSSLFTNISPSNIDLFTKPLTKSSPFTFLPLLSPLLVLWIYSLLTVLQQPLLADTSAILNTLYRYLAIIREKADGRDENWEFPKNPENHHNDHFLSTASRHDVAFSPLGISITRYEWDHYCSLKYICAELTRNQSQVLMCIIKNRFNQGTRDR